MYHSVSYILKLNNAVLDPITSKLGLRQGGVLSPLLFNLFVDDIKQVFDETCDPIFGLDKPLSHLLYADDLVLMSTSKNGLKNCLAKLEIYCHTWQLEVNIKKSEVVIFNLSGRKLVGPQLYFQNKPLKTVQSYCYLGVDLLCSGSFRAARGNLMDKACKAMFPLFSAVSNFHLPCAKALQLFHSLIKPITLYNAENWATLTHHQISSLEQNKTTLWTYITTSESSKVHLKFLKLILGLKRNCSNAATLGEVGEFPLMMHGFVHLLTYWHRVANLPNTTLAKQAFNLQMDGNILPSEWAATVKYLLSLLGMDDQFRNPLLTNIHKYSKVCMVRIKAFFISQWRSQVNNGLPRLLGGNKLRFYKQFKTSFQMEPYLNLIDNFHLRKCISKFRCSDHVLELETGRHKQIKLEERLCKMCKVAVETEEHFLRFCPKYNHLRLQYFGNVSSFLECVTIMQCDDRKSAFNLAHFLTKSFKIRKDDMVITA